MNTKRFSEAMNEIDNKYVSNALNYHRKKHLRLMPCAAGLAVFIGICGFACAVSVYQGVGPASHIAYDKLTQPFGTIASDQPLHEDHNNIFSEKSTLIHDYETVYADHSVCVATENMQIPSIYFSPAYMVIFSQENEQGWTLNQGEKLTLDFSLDHTQSLELEIGYILNGEYYIRSITKGNDFAETLTIPQTGEYYFCVTNHSSSNAVIESGSVTIQ